MQQFTVPQFIDVEDKIIGPITARQFIIMLAGLMLIGLSYKIFTFALFMFIGMIIFTVTGIFAFFKVNGMPFHFFALNFVQTTQKANVRVWNNSFGKEEASDEDTESLVGIREKHVRVRSYNQSRLNELSLIVDTRGVYQGEEQMHGANLRVVEDGVEELNIQ